MMNQVVTTCQSKDSQGVCKWLQWLLLVNIISLSLGVLTKALNVGFMNSWLQIVCSMSILFCLLQLRRKHRFYLVAVVFLSIDLVCTVLQTFLLGDTGFRLLLKLYQENVNIVIAEVSRVFMVILLICGLGASIFEYLAHSKLIKQTDQRLSKYWIWLTVSTVILFAVMRVVNLIFIDMLEKGTLDIEQYQRFYPLMNLPAMLLRIGYVVCLFLTWRGKVREAADLPECSENIIQYSEEEVRNQKKRLYIALCLAAIGIVLICVAVAFTIASMSKMSIIGGADWPVFRLILSNGENGLYFMMISFGCAAVLASIIVSSKGKRLKKAAILVLPLLLFQILRVPYDWLNEKFIVEWLGCGCVSGFNANHITGLFWLFIAICTTVISFFTSGKVLKDKKWLRILYIVGMLLISLLVARRYYYMMFWN